MEKAEFLIELARLVSNYNNFIPSENEKVMIANEWYSTFRKFDKKIFRSAISQWIRSERFKPTIADVMDLIYQQNSLNGYSFDELWGFVENGFRNGKITYGGRYDHSETYRDFPKELKEILSYQSFANLGRIDLFQLSKEKERYKQLFENKRKEKKKEFLLSENPMELLPYWKTKQMMIEMGEE